MRQAQRFCVAEGGGQHTGRRVLVSRPGERIRSSDPLDDAPLRGRRAFLGRKAFRQVNGLSCAASGKQPADADLADGESVEEDFVPLVGLQGPTSPRRPSEAAFGSQEAAAISVLGADEAGIWRAARDAETPGGRAAEPNESRRSGILGP
jgi:hypothetical protein